MDLPNLPDGLPVKPQGERDLLDDLSLAELRVANAKCRADVVDAIQRPTADRWDALALVGWLWHKRQDPRASLALWTGLTVAQLSLAVFGPPDEVDEDQVDDDEAPAGPAEDAPAWTDDLGAEVDRDPTAPGPSPSSPAGGEPTR